MSPHTLGVALLAAISVYGAVKLAWTLIPGLYSRSKAADREYARLTEIARDRNRVWRAEQINAARAARAEAHNHHEPPTKPNLTPIDSERTTA